MEQSILKSTKKMLGIGEDDESFDHDILTHINSAFFTLYQLGIGPLNGFAIEDEETEWSEYELDRGKLGIIKTCVHLRVRVLFDPPDSSYLLDSITKQIEEHEWRLNVQREEEEWADPDPVPVEDQ